MNCATRPFQQYAGAYDSIYRDKDYDAECRFVESAVSLYQSVPVKTILDLGCGTGGHAVPFAKKGYSVTGVDMSADMLTRARRKAESEGCAGGIDFVHSDITAVELGQKYDLVVCMFAVLSYLTTNPELVKAFSVASEHLKPGGLFVCDFWYGPAVLRDLPCVREKIVQGPEGEIVRKATPTIHFNENVVEVLYELSTRSSDKSLEIGSEQHSMRYLFLPEVKLFAALAGLDFIHACSCCELEVAASDKTWTITAIFRAR